MENANFCQKIVATEGFDLTKLMQTAHAYFSDNANKFAVAIEREGKDFGFYVFAETSSELISLCDYIENNKYLKRSLSFGRLKPVPDSADLVEYRRIRIPTQAKANADAEYILSNTGDKEKSCAARNRPERMLKEHDNSRYINVKTSSGNNFMIRVDKINISNGVSGGVPDSYGFSGKTHQLIVPDPKSFY